MRWKQLYSFSAFVSIVLSTSASQLFFLISYGHDRRRIHAVGSAQIEMVGASSMILAIIESGEPFGFSYTSSSPTKHANPTSFSHDPVARWKLPTDSV